jgi:hypothetical protein
MLKKEKKSLSLSHSRTHPTILKVKKIIKRLSFHLKKPSLPITTNETTTQLKIAYTISPL